MAASETKDIILANAICLFSEKGFDGVSVRDIAGKAEVNLAAINYHFKNKENLFKECLCECFFRISEKMKELVSNNGDLTVDEMALKMFRLFVKEAEMFRTGFRIFLLDTELTPESFGTDDDEIGPPGGQMLYTFIQNKFPTAKEDDLLWAVRIIFSLIMHKSLLFTSKFLKANKKIMQSNQDDFERDIQRFVKLAITDIKN